MDGYRFSTELRVRFNETDLQGVAHHANHVVWLEVARIAYLDRVDGGYLALRGTGVDVTTTDVAVRYRAGVRFDDRLRIWVRVVDLRGTRFRFEYVLERLNEPAGVVGEASTGHACIDAATLRPTRMPAELAERFAALEAG